MNRGIFLKKGDITKLQVDCIVNAANCSLLGGGGVDGAIHRAAGRELLEECRRLNGCNIGEAKITKGYQLPAKHVIHTVGPVWSGRPEEAGMLHDCYYNSLELAKENDLHSIAFPAISTGVYGYPIREAAGVALTAVREWMGDNPGYEMEIVLICFDDRAYDAYEELLGSE